MNHVPPYTTRISRFSLLLSILSFLLLGESVHATSRGDVSPSLLLSVQQNKLSVDIDRVPLREVLETLTDHIPVAIAMKGFEGDHPLSASFTDLPLVKGIERLLLGYDYALLYARPHSVPGDSGQPRLREVVVLPRHSPSPRSTAVSDELILRPPEPNQPIQVSEGQTFLEDVQTQASEVPGPSDRVDALITIADQNEDAMLPILSTASQDQDPDVRATAIVLLSTQEETRSEHMLKTALQDSDPVVRELAKELLEGVLE